MDKNEIQEVLNTKYTMREYVDLIKKIKIKYGTLCNILKQLQEYRNDILNIEFETAEDDKNLVDTLYDKINAIVNVTRIKSKYDASEVNEIEFKDNLGFELLDIKEAIISHLDSIYKKNIEKNKDNELNLTHIKMIVCAALDKFIDAIYEEKEIDVLIYEQYKKEFYKLKRIYEIDDCVDEFTVDNLVDGNEIIQ